MVSEKQNEVLNEMGEAKSQGIREKFFSFKGRINRRNFWIRNFILVIVYLILYLVIDISYEYTDVLFGLLLNFIGCIILWVASLSLSARRWHDLDKSGIYILAHIFIIPAIYCACKKGTDGINKYGPEDI